VFVFVSSSLEQLTVGMLPKMFSGACLHFMRPAVCPSHISVSMHWYKT